MVIPCLPNRKETRQQQQQQQQPSNNSNRHSFHGDNGLHAFDLTWRNYIPSISQFCCCLNKNGNIRLTDDDDQLLIEPAYYNDHTLYRGEALDNPARDWEFESILNGGNNNNNNDHFPQFVTRNPFGTKSIKSSSNSNKKKKSSTKHKKKNRGERHHNHHHHHHHNNNNNNVDGGPVVMETDLEEGYITGYDIEDNQYCGDHYHDGDDDDAEFLGDDQIANLAYNRHSSQVMDQYGEELYYQHIQGPIIQEMQAPPPAPPREFYAAKTMPNVDFSTDEQENYDDYEERIIVQQQQQQQQQQQEPSSSSLTTNEKPQASIEAAQALLSETLDDLTEKLAFIKNNIIHIQPSSSYSKTKTGRNDGDDEYDKSTLHTIKRVDQEEEEEQQQQQQDSKNSSSDLDSITSEALNVYENTTNTTYEQQPTISRRYSSLSSDELHLPSLVDNTPFVSDQHPFTYFTTTEEEEQSTSSSHHNSSNTNNSHQEEHDDILNVFDLGRKWFFSASSNNNATTD